MLHFWSWPLATVRDKLLPKLISGELRARNKDDSSWGVRDGG
jgi:hypothetical protein